MNGYLVASDSYRQLLESNAEVDKVKIKKTIKALDFLATCDRVERTELFNSGAFNNILKGYFLMAINNQNLDGNIKEGLMGEIKSLLDTVPATEAEDYYNKNLL